MKIVPIDTEHSTVSKWQKTKKILRKYFWEGQILSGEIAVEDPEVIVSNVVNIENRILSHRKLVGILIPFTFWQCIWWCLAVKNDYFTLFSSGYKMSITMIFGALVAGMVSDGGGAIVFPVMTLFLQMTPKTARDFTLLIQSFGMTSATFCILWMKVHLEWRAIVYSSLGGIAGIIFGLEFLDPRLEPDVKKMIFVSSWFSFAVALFILNRQKKRIAHSKERRLKLI